MIQIPVNNLKDKYNEFKKLMQYSNELSRRCKYISNHFLNLKLYLILLESLNNEEKNLLLEGMECSSLAFFSDFRKKSFRENKESFKSILNYVQNNNKNKFIVDILRIYYYKYKNDTNSLKDLVSALSMNTKLFFDGISSFQ